MNINDIHEAKYAPTGQELLIVDDDARLRRVLVTCYSEKKFNVSDAFDAFEAINTLNLRHIDVVLTDFRMPGMNGLELAQWIRKHHPETAICLMSSEAANADFCMTIAPTVDGWIAKPFLIAALDASLTNAIAHKTHRIENAPTSSNAYGLP